jgi:hypothetical protein
VRAGSAESLLADAFSRISHECLKHTASERVADPVTLRLILRCPEPGSRRMGSPSARRRNLPGGAISCVVAKIHLHHVPNL